MNAPVREGEILAGKYRVDKVLGVGGMGVVVAAHHLELDERVAIKFMLPDALANAEAVSRFAREARAAVKIKSEHVARLSDVGKLDNGAPYMVMEYLEGSDLAAWLDQRGALPVEQAAEFVLQACEAIAEAHALGIVHRDLKPANIFVIRRPDGVLSVKVLDFGISKMTSLTGSGGDSSMTKTSALMGSPLYMSPEQMQSSKNVDARSDIWALGIILYELIGGEPPFGGDTMPELILQIMSASPTPLRNKRPDAPDGLEAVIFRCLEKDRGKRFETVGDFAVALLPFAPKRSRSSVERISGVMRGAGFSATARELPPSSDGNESRPADAGTASSWGRTTTRKSRGPWMIASLGVVVTVVIAAAVLTRHSSARAGGSAAAASAASATPVATPIPAIAVAPHPNPTVAPEVTPTTDALVKAAPSVPANPSPSAGAEPRSGHVARVTTPAQSTVKSRLRPSPTAVSSPAPTPAAPAVQPAPATPKTSNMFDDRK